MSVFDPESTRNDYQAGWELTGSGGDPYRFHLAFDIDDEHVTVRHLEDGRWYIELHGMSMGDMIGLNRHLARQISDAKRERRERDQQERGMR
ncbi:hypothetical protein [Bifidobacterium simiiventris]|uniref:hypothetical protein n=1 Tax=Bifidobacterium simiiventris TaxID=2834434 RepID=UPI001C58D3AB|nr:hypothetical protein [Bifidobacterium simiiventris]MBW3077727.1 hypothetical protein [Bifidobacterium simiiventris]